MIITVVALLCSFESVTFTLKNRRNNIMRLGVEKIIWGRAITIVARTQLERKSPTFSSAQALLIC